MNSKKKRNSRKREIQEKDEFKKKRNSRKREIQEKRKISHYWFRNFGEVSKFLDLDVLIINAPSVIL